MLIYGIIIKNQGFCLQLFLFFTTQQNRKDKKMATETKDPQKKSNAITRFLGEFKEFISKGNVLDMAVGVVVGSDCRHQLPRPRLPYSVGQSSLYQHWCISLRCHHISDYCILCIPDCQGSQHDAKSDLQEKRRRKERRTGKGCSRHCPAD